VTEAKLYAGTLLDGWRFELRPGETKSHVFQVVRADASQIAVVVGTQMIVNTVKDWDGEVEAPDFMKHVHTRSTRRGFDALKYDNQLAQTT
jgi:hypothetical protein